MRYRETLEGYLSRLEMMFPDGMDEEDDTAYHRRGSLHYIERQNISLSSD